MNQISFALAQLRISSSPAFPALILDDEAVVPVDAILPLAARFGFALTEPHSLDGLLRNWDRNFAGLSAVVAALDDKTEGKYFRSAVSSLSFFSIDCPVTAPRQIFSSDSLGGGSLLPRIVSTLVGPTAKILVPARTDCLWAEAKIGMVIARPLYRATQRDAAEAIAGFVTVADYTVAQDWMEGRSFAAKQSPTLLSIGPYFLPAAFMAPQEEIVATLPVNGVSQGGFSGRDLPGFAEKLAALSQDVQLFPGDLVCLGPSTNPETLPRLCEGDIIEAAVSGLGRQTTNTMKDSSH
ncbi:MAG: fumarylacetoacetate hydrolase family protein [Hydrogenophaga sp.]|nr:fumarylacetoacetate hydrolase family protein [Hydrogenophaga sp.]